MCCGVSWRGTTLLARGPRCISSSFSPCRVASQLRVAREPGLCCTAHLPSPSSSYVVRVLFSLLIVPPNAPCFAPHPNDFFTCHVHGFNAPVLRSLISRPRKRRHGRRCQLLLQMLLLLLQPLQMRQGRAIYSAWVRACVRGTPPRALAHDLT